MRLNIENLIKKLSFSPQPTVETPKIGGPDRDQTDDLVVANDALYQLSYCPEREGRFWAIARRE